MKKYFKLEINPVVRPDATHEIRGGETSVPISFDPGVFEKDVASLRLRTAIFTIDAYDAACERVGAALFSTFFPGPLKDQFRLYEQQRYEEGKRAEVLLFLPDGLHWLPWELLRTPNLKGDKAYLTLNGAVYRYVHEPNNLQYVIKTITDATSVPLRMLYAHSSPTSGDYTPIPELDKVENPRIDLRPVPPIRSFIQFQKQMKQEWDGFLFHGHGTREAGVGRLIFSLESEAPDPISVTDLAKLTQTCRTKLLILSACDTASFAQRTFQDSMIGAVFQYGYPSCAVAYQSEIDATAAKKFAGSLMASLGQHSLQVCMQLARHDVRAIGQVAGAGVSQQRAARDWWLPVIYASTLNPEVVPLEHERIALPDDGTAKGDEPTEEEFARVFSWFKKIRKPVAITRASGITDKESIHVTIDP